MSEKQLPVKTTTDGFTVGYHLGTIGTWLRLVVGVAVPLTYLALELGWGDLTAGNLGRVVGWFGAVLGAYFVVHLLLGERVLARVGPWVSTLVLYGPVFVVPYLDFLPVTFRVALSLYIAISLLVAVFIRYGGCEMVGFPSLILGRRYPVYCPWNAIDMADKMITQSRWSHLVQGLGPKITAAVAMAGALVGYPELSPPLPDLPRLVFWAVVGLIGGATLGLWAVARAVGGQSMEPRSELTVG